MALSSRALWYSRYSMGGHEGFKQGLHRVANAIGKNQEQKDRFFNVMDKIFFLPAGRVLANAGTDNHLLFNCAVLPVEDDMKSILDTNTRMGLLWKAGCGVGVNISPLRAEGSIVKGALGEASGPVSFVDIYDATASTIKQGGNRRAALMVILNDDHKDIFKFIDAKQNDNIRWTNCNISIMITNGPENCPPGVLDRIAEGMWDTAEPGVLFLDNIQAQAGCENVVATNPCSEAVLPPFTFCNLGSPDWIDIWNSSTSQEDFLNRLKSVYYTSLEMLDNIYDVTDYCLPEMKESSLKDRRLGSGIMGLADYFMANEVVYGKDNSLQLLEDALIARNEAGDRWSMDSGNHNVVKFSVAPTGTISHIAGCSAGIEPIFHFIRKEKHGDEYVPYIHPMYEKYGGRGKKLPEWMVTAEQVPAEEHLAVQALIQKYTDQSVSKTIWIPKDSTFGYVKDIIKRAYNMGIKGLTIWRDGCKRAGAIRKADKCPNCGAIVESVEGACFFCAECGYSACSL